MTESKCPYAAEIDGVMSNLFREIKSDVAARLKVEDAFSRYAGWNFNGLVWWDRALSVWQCEVWVYKAPREVVSAATLEEIMSIVSDKYGSD